MTSINYTGNSVLGATLIYENDQPIGNLSIMATSGPIQLLGMTPEFMEGMAALLFATAKELLGTKNSSEIAPAKSFKLIEFVPTPHNIPRGEILCIHELPVEGECWDCRHESWCLGQPCNGECRKEDALNDLIEQGADWQAETRAS